MKMEKLTKISDKLSEWGCPLLVGFKALVRCAVVAAQHEEWDESWTSMGVCQEVAALMGKTQWSLWQGLRNTLRKSRSAPRSVAAAISLLVKEVTG